MRLTKPNVAKLELPAGKAEAIVFDDALRGFGVRIRAGGKRTWIVQYRVGTKQRRITLGTVEALDPDRARKVAKDVLSRAQLGSDPQIEKAEARARASLTTGMVVQRYLEVAAQRQRERSFSATRRYLTQLWAPLHEIPISHVKRAMVAVRLTEIARDHGPVTANRARQSLSTFFGWAMREGLTEANPVTATNQAAEEKSRERVLSDDELAAIWRACPDDNFGAIVRLLMLTGQRRDEVGGLRRSEIDLNRALWSLPPHRTKNGRPHEVPLSAPALAIITAAMAASNRTVLFGYEERPFSGWSSAKAALEKRLKEAATPIAEWRLHDLRRTAATRMADMGTLPHVIEAILNHASGHKAGIAGVYNRAVYAKEKREALDVWADHVLAIVSDAPADKAGAAR
ncbi:site-specific integrase [Microvirga sp. KLBC 81]|uniref:tyrosine-type recombinase/integrase n=1 Tax=Microvirga sp. KLBC 81 TaxID=1862707 RepID=UPI000D50FED5|nr:site-specific integrase [Microvirga sp. KLBC 81]PVE23642.1 site-specific integrase [Microvirga sp. KLBC 81]